MALVLADVELINKKANFLETTIKLLCGHVTGKILKGET